MIILVCFTALGFAAGFVLRLPVFTALLLLTVVGYAVFSATFEGALRLAYHAVLVGIACQIGYFAAIVTQAVFRSRSRGPQIRTNSSSWRNVSRGSHEEKR
jgi:voltage-gated potassium channel Kch